MTPKQIDTCVVSSMFKAVKKELRATAMEEAKNKIRNLLTQRANAQKVLANIDREIEDLKLQLSQEFE